MIRNNLCISVTYFVKIDKKRYGIVVFKSGDVYSIIRDNDLIITAQLNGDSEPEILSILTVKQRAYNNEWESEVNSLVRSDAPPQKDNAVKNCCSYAKVLNLLVEWSDVLFEYVQTFPNKNVSVFRLDCASLALVAGSDVTIVHTFNCKTFIFVPQEYPRAMDGSYAEVICSILRGDGIGTSWQYNMSQSIYNKSSQLIDKWNEMNTSLRKSSETDVVSESSIFS